MTIQPIACTHAVIDDDGHCPACAAAIQHAERVDAACRAAWPMIGDPVPWPQVAPSRADVFRHAITLALAAGATRSTPQTR